LRPCDEPVLGEILADMVGPGPGPLGQCSAAPLLARDTV